MTGRLHEQGHVTEANQLWPCRASNGNSLINAPFLGLPTAGGLHLLGDASTFNAQGVGQLLHTYPFSASHQRLWRGNVWKYPLPAPAGPVRETLWVLHTSFFKKISLNPCLDSQYQGSQDLTMLLMPKSIYNSARHHAPTVFLFSFITTDS